MNPSPSQITTTDTIVVLINAMLGAAIFMVPRSTALAGGTPDVWISIILSGAIVAGMGCIMVGLCRKYPGKTLFEFMPEITGKWIAIPIGLCMIVYFLVRAAYEIRIMAEVTGMYLLERTPLWAITMIFMWIGMYMLLGGLKVIVRVLGIILPITLVLFVLEILFSIQLFDLNNLRPLLGEGILPVVKGVKPGLLSFIGFEVMFILAASMKKPNEGRKAVLWSTGITTAFYLITVVMVIGSLSLDGMWNRTWPTLDLVRSFEIEGLVFERFESFLLIIWIMQIYAVFAISHYSASIGVSGVFRIKHVQGIICTLLPFVYLVTMIPKNVEETIELGYTLDNVFLVLFGIVPVLLLSVSLIRKKGGKGDKACAGNVQAEEETI